MLYGTQQKQKGYFNSGRVISVAIVNVSDTSGVRGDVCNEPIIRRGEVSMLPIHRVGLTPDVPCLQRTAWMQVWVGVDY